MESKVYSLLGFASKSRNLQTGYNTCQLAINRNNIKLIILATDLAPNSKGKMVKLCKSKQIKYHIFSTMDQLSKCTGKSNCGIFGITESGFAEAIDKEIDLIQSEKEAE